jgi:hypothetical protein
MNETMCQYCRRTFNVKPYRAKVAKFCSRRCRALSMVGKPHGHRTNNGQSWKWSKEARLKLKEILLQRNYHHSAETKLKLSKAMTGKMVGVNNPFFGKTHTLSVRKRLAMAGRARIQELHPLWKGSDVTYRALHERIERRFGKAIKCELCGATRRKTRIHWSNRNHQYSLERRDWQQLCCKHHDEYDRREGLR